MARGKTLLELTTQLRAEIGASPSVAQSLNSVPYWQQVLRRTQERLYNETMWPFLIVDRDEPLLAGERYYTFNADVNFDFIQQAWIKYNTQWEPIPYGIDPSLYNCDDSDLDRTNEPVRRWSHYEGNQFEVWPIPSIDLTQSLRFRCLKQLAPLVNAEDMADLDDVLIVLFAAAEILERQKSPDAKSKAELANRHYLSLRRNSLKSGPFILGGKCPPANGQRHCDSIRVKRLE